MISCRMVKMCHLLGRAEDLQMGWEAIRSIGPWVAYSGLALLSTALLARLDGRGLIADKPTCTR